MVVLAGVWCPEKAYLTQVTNTLGFQGEVKVAEGVGPLWHPGHYPLRVPGNLHKLASQYADCPPAGATRAGIGRTEAKQRTLLEIKSQAMEQGHGTAEASCHSCLGCWLGQVK